MFVHIGLLLATATNAQPAEYEQLQRDRVCPLVLIREAVPAEAEWTWWLSGGGGQAIAPDSTRSVRAEVGAGFEATIGLLRYRGFPAGCYGRGAGDGELRVGPWAAVATNFHGAVLEAGLKLHLGAIYHASWGTFDLRVGAGSGFFDNQPSPHLTATVAYGVRSVLERYTERGACDPRPIPAARGYGSVVRLFATVRRPLEVEMVQWVFGVEFTPSFFVPPYSWFRVAGGPP